MLRNTFVHLPGIGPRREKSLWDRGILDWHQFLAAADGGILPGHNQQAALTLVRQSLAAVTSGNADFFKSLLPSGEAWRLYPEFADRAVFIDIETTGLSGYDDQVTVIGALDAGGLKLFVQGLNLDQFPAYIEQFPLLVSFNGCQFDVPFLRVHFPHARLDQAHVDLRFVLASLGYRGGLKAVEQRLGLRRDPLIQGVDGFEAVRLWHRYRRGDRAALEKLILYNLTDVVNLVELSETAIRLKYRRVAFPGTVPDCAPRSTPALDREVVAGHLAACSHGTSSVTSTRP
ncbi:MAG: ribonuclease H-like domain-containing protein [Planctomycetota bacterium]|nr:ribonuclease H-like domain-containing protein [Planctomycetota bacterium]